MVHHGIGPLTDATNHAVNPAVKAPVAGQADQASFDNLYPRQKLLGTGATAEVWARKSQVTGDVLACKTFHMGSMRLLEKVAVKREVGIMQRLKEEGGHPNIVYLKEVVGSTSASAKGDVHVLMEACLGGSLMDLILSHNRMPEPSVRHLVCQLASALNFCHSLGILHRDIKPDNIFLDRPADSLYFSPGSSPVQAKLGDFGLACILSDGGSAVGLAGTKYYTAPEILDGRMYGTSADIWSLGVVVCAALTAKLPFKGENDEDDVGLRRAVMASQINFSLPAWEGISAEAKDLVAWMVHPDPEKRPSAADILAHPWCSRKGTCEDDNQCRCSGTCQLRPCIEGSADFKACLTGLCLAGPALCAQESILAHAATVPVEAEAFHCCSKDSPILQGMSSCLNHSGLCCSGSVCACAGECSPDCHSGGREHYAIDAC